MGQATTAYRLRHFRIAKLRCPRLPHPACRFLERWRRFLGSTVYRSSAVYRRLVGPYSALRPSYDVAANGWLPSTGTDLFAMIDEVVPADGDYDYSPDNPTTQYMEVKLGPADSPLAGTRTLSVRLSAIGHDTHFVIDLRQGASSVQTFAHDVAVADGVVQFDDEVTATITDYGDLRLRVTASAA
jgi:hypothetical protein